MKLINYFESAGYGSQQRMADAIGSTKSDLSNWKNGKAVVPAKYCKAIEKFTNGKVTVKDLRPDDWQVYWG